MMLAAESNFDMLLLLSDKTIGGGPHAIPLLRRGSAAVEMRSWRTHQKAWMLSCLAQGKRLRGPK